MEHLEATEDGHFDETETKFIIRQVCEKVTRDGRGWAERKYFF
jgi:hypothetical protein